MTESATDGPSPHRGLLLGSVAVGAVLVIAAANWFIFASDDNTSNETPTGASIEIVDVSLDLDEVVVISEDGSAVTGFDENGSLCREWIGDTGPAIGDIVCVEVDEDLVSGLSQGSWTSGEQPILFDNSRLILDSYVVDFEDATAIALPQFDDFQMARAYQAETGAMVFWDQELVETGPTGEVVNQYPDVTTRPTSVTWLANGTMLLDQSGTGEMIQISGGESAVVDTGGNSTLLLDGSPNGDAALVLDELKLAQLDPTPVSIVDFDMGSTAALPLPNEEALFLEAWFSQDESLVFGIWASLADGSAATTLSVIELDHDRAATSGWITLHEWQQVDTLPMRRSGFGSSDTGAAYLTIDGLSRVVFTYD